MRFFDFGALTYFRKNWSIRSPTCTGVQFFFVASIIALTLQDPKDAGSARLAADLHKTKEVRLAA